MDVVILTPLNLEFTAVKEHLANWNKDMHPNYDCVSLKGEFQELQIALKETEAKNSNVALATKEAIEKLNPKVILLVGIAGGVKDPKVGDLVVGEKAYGYESGKETDEGFLVRPEVYPHDRDLILLAKRVSEEKKWLSRLKSEINVDVIFGPIASGDKVVTSKKSKVYETLYRSYNDTQAIEMEAVGFAQAVARYPLVRSLNIRGISDLLDGKSAATDELTQPNAAAIAAAFAIELLSQLDLSKLNFPQMDSKELSQKVFELIFPLIKMDSVKEIGHEFTDATNTTIRELWAKVKPLFIEEFKELKADPEDADLQGMFRTQLKRKLEKNDSLKAELNALVEKAKATPEGQVIIANSKNVIQGSNISVGGDFRLGDG